MRKNNKKSKKLRAHRRAPIVNKFHHLRTPQLLREVVLAGCRIGINQKMCDSGVVKARMLMMC